MGSPVTILDPTGTPRAVPADQVPAALQAGGQRAIKMSAPSGQLHWIPENQAQQAAAAGGKVVDDTFAHVAGAGPGAVPQLAAHPNTPAMQSSLLAPSTYGKAISDTVSGLATPLAHIPSQIASYGGFKNPSEQGGPIQSIVNNPDKGAGVADAIAQIGTTVALGKGMQGAAKIAPEVPGAIGKAVTGAGEVAQDAGTRLMNNTVGTLKSDFKRGANPARGYLETGNGTSLTMQGIADKAVASKQAVGQALGNAYASASDSGLKIPVDVVAQQMAKPIQKALDLATGPGGTGDTSAIRSYVEQFGPTFDRAAANGGFTPKELFDMKEAIAKNTNWSDPSQFSLKTVRQQQTGSLSGILSEAVPETAGLNQHYQDLTKLANRAGERANTGSRPLTAHIYKAGLTATGALAGALDGHALAGAAVGTVLDSVPFKTTLATGLYRGGGALTTLGDRLASGRPVVAGEVAPSDLEANGTNDKGQNPQLPPPGLPELRASSNATTLRGLPSGYKSSELPSSTAGNVPTAASPSPPLNAATARMRVQPLAPARPVSLPLRGTIAVAPSGEAMLPVKSLSAPEASTESSKPLTGKALWTQKGTANLAAHGVSSADLDTLASTAKGKDLLVIASGLTPGSPAMKNLLKQARKLLNP